jgi:hypothetical protein
MGNYNFFVIKNCAAWIYKIAFSQITALCSIALITVAWKDSGS